MCIRDRRIFGSTRLATLGAKTAEALKRRGIDADFVPTVFTGKDLGTQLLAHTNLHDKKVLLLRSELASNELVGLLAEGGARVEDVSLYTGVVCKGDAASLTGQIRAGEIDWLTFASPSSARGFFEQIPPDAVESSKAKIASIGPVTSRQLAELGVRVDLEAAEHTIDGMLDAIENVESGNL